MTRFSATSLDLSRVDRSALFPDLSFETIRTDRLTDFKARLTAAGIDYDVETLETDPGVIGQEASGYRELLVDQSIYDAEANVLLAFASGGFLDRLGDMHGTARLTGEDDDRYRARVQLAPEAFSNAGTPGGYIYHAMSVSTDVRDVGLTVVNKGTRDVGVELAVLSKIGTGAPSDDLMKLVRDQVGRNDVRLATDNVMVRGVKVVEYDVAATLYMRAGPDPVVIRTNANAALTSVADRYKRVGGDVPVNALSAALYVAGVERVMLTSPAADIVTLRFQAAHMRAVDLRVEVLRD
jgi:phage-related baseplate assembly protein